MKLHKKVKRAALEEAAFFNAQLEFRPGKNHPIILHLSLGDQHRSVAMSKNDPDKQADWVRQDIRRLVNDIRRCA